MLKIDVQPWALGPRWCAKGGRDPDVSRGGAAQPHESTKWELQRSFCISCANRSARYGLLPITGVSLPGEEHSVARDLWLSSPLTAYGEEMQRLIFNIFYFFHILLTRTWNLWGYNWRKQYFQDLVVWVASSHRYSMLSQCAEDIILIGLMQTFPRWMICRLFITSFLLHYFICSLS